MQVKAIGNSCIMNRKCSGRVTVALSDRGTMQRAESPVHSSVQCSSAMSTVEARMYTA